LLNAKKAVGELDTARRQEKRPDLRALTRPAASAPPFF
jgi:hypothetical protein